MLLVAPSLWFYAPVLVLYVVAVRSFSCSMVTGCFVGLPRRREFEPSPSPGFFLCCVLFSIRFVSVLLRLAV